MKSYKTKHWACVKKISQALSLNLNDLELCLKISFGLKSSVGKGLDKCNVLPSTLVCFNFLLFANIH